MAAADHRTAVASTASTRWRASISPNSWWIVVILPAQQASLAYKRPQRRRPTIRRVRPTRRLFLQPRCADRQLAVKCTGTCGCDCSLATGQIHALSILRRSFTWRPLSGASVPHKQRRRPSGRCPCTYLRFVRLGRYKHNVRPPTSSPSDHKRCSRRVLLAGPCTWWLMTLVSGHFTAYVRRATNAARRR